MILWHSYGGLAQYCGIFSGLEIKVLTAALDWAGESLYFRNDCMGQLPKTFFFMVLTIDTQQHFCEVTWSYEVSFVSSKCDICSIFVVLNVMSTEKCHILQVPSTNMI